MLKVTMLQTPRIELDGETVSLPFKRADALLYYMMVQRSATRQELIALLWEGSDEATGLKNLRNALYTLKKALGGDVLISPQKSLIEVNEGWEIESDYDRFVRRGDFSAYEGQFLQGFAVKRAFSYDEWINRTREKLREQYLRELGQRARAAHAAGDERGALHWGQVFLREEPYDEGMASFLMERYREGQKFPAAAKVYQKLKDCLLQDLGVAPQESTTLLYYEIMNQWNDNSAEADESWVPAGRESDFAALRAALSSFSAGAALRCSQLLRGEIGSGKSELIGSLLSRSDLSELLVLKSYCLPSEAETPLAPWERLLRPLREFARSEGMDGGEDMERLDERLLLLFTAVSRRKRILLVLEDLQWADETSIQLLERLLRHTESGTVMAVLSARLIVPEHIRKSLDKMQNDGLLHARRLYPLNREQTEKLLCSELGTAAAKDLADSFYSQTGGNLRLLTELSAAYRRHGNLDASLDRLADILLDRLRRLSADGTRVMQCLTVFPESAPYAALLEMLCRDDRQLDAGLEELRQLGVVEERRGEETGFAFIHARMRELSYERLPLLRRRTLHRQAATALSQMEARDGKHCRAVAGHYRLAEDRLLALYWQTQALCMDTARLCEPFSIYGGEGLPAFDAAALEEELQGLLRELALLPRDGNEAVPMQLGRLLTLCRGRLALYRGELESGTELLGTLCDGMGTPAVAVQACMLLAVTAIHRQQPEAAERAIAMGMRHANTLELAVFQRLRGGCFSLRGDYDKSRYYLQDAQDALESLPRTAAVRLQLAGLCCDFGKVCRIRREYAESRAYFRQALALLGDEAWPGSVWVYVHYGRMAYVLEDHGRAGELFERGLDTAQKSGEPWGAAAAAAYVSWYRAQDGDWEAAAEALRFARDSIARLSSPLEELIVNYASMIIRARMDAAGGTCGVLEALLPYSPESYARQGIRRGGGTPDVFEAEQMSRGLREGINARRTYRVSDLYSKNKHFMAE